MLEEEEEEDKEEKVSYMELLVATKKKQIKK